MIKTPIILILFLIYPFAESANLKAKKSNDVVKAFHIDCGRKYFTVEELKLMIDNCTVNDYNAIELAIGNDGMRFLLDDMAISFDDKNFTSEQIRDAIDEGNKVYHEFLVNELTQAEMDQIIEYAYSKKIDIIPLVNSPGHMDAILYACTMLTSDCSYWQSATTIDVTNDVAKKFTQAIIQKFVTYFGQKGCKIFNLGGDEYANDKFGEGSMGFGHLMEEGKYGDFINYMNDLAAKVSNAGMIPMAFNDGFYFKGNLSAGILDMKFMVSYWSTGWGEYQLYPADKLAKMGYKILNTNSNWYYVLHWEDITGGSRSFDDTLKGINDYPYNNVIGSGTMDVEGCMICYWCDQPHYPYDETEQGYMATMIAEFAKKNPEIFNP